MNTTNIYMAVLFLASLLLGAVVYVTSGFDAATLVIDARTLEKGRGEVHVEHAGTRQVDTLQFEIGDDQGAASFYTVGLPAARLERLTIAPLARQGNYEISRITLSNDSVSYILDAQGGCTQKLLRNGLMQRQPCSQGPVMEFAPDGAMVINSIPDVGVEKKPLARVATAIMVALLIFCSGIWLLRPVEPGRWQSRTHCLAVRVGWLLVATLYSYHLYMVCKYAVDIPFFEEWEYFRPQSLTKDFSWSWLFAFADYHRIVTTKLVVWLNLKLFSLDFAWQKIFNFLAFGCLICAVVAFKERVVGKGGFTFFPAFVLFVLSPIAYENHVVAFQLQIHLVLISLLCTLLVAFRERPSIVSTAVFCLLSLLMIYSYSAGLVAGVVLLLCRSLFRVTTMAAGKIPLKEGLVEIALNWVLIVPGLVFWFSGYHKVGKLPPLILPTDARFWDTFLNLVSFGFGFRVENVVPGVVCLVVTILPVILLLMRKDRRIEVSTWQILAAILAILGALAAMSTGRGSFIGASKTSRYAEFGFLLIPFASIAWWLVIRDRPRRYAWLAILWVGCFVSYLNDWSFSVYRDVKQIDTATLECVEQYAREGGDGVCNETYYRPIGEYFERARQLDVHFTRQFAGTGR